MATGHARGGVLLAPATSEAVSRLLAGLPLPGLVEPFTPTRFARPLNPVTEGR